MVLARTNVEVELSNSYARQLTHGHPCIVMTRIAEVVDVACNGEFFLLQRVLNGSMRSKSVIVGTLMAIWDNVEEELPLNYVHLLAIIPKSIVITLTHGLVVVECHGC